jgi:type I restriction enzyme S subunit
MSWNCQSVNQLCERIRGVSYKKGDASNIPEKGYVPILRANNIGDDATLNYDGLVYVPADKVSAKQKLKVGDVVVAMSTGSSRVIGKTAQLNQEWQGAFGAFCGVLRPKNNVDARYFGHYFKTKEYRNGISGLAAGTNINNIKAEHFDEIEIPLPPLSEQRRIADKLDILLAKVNKCKSRLERIPEILKRFRQSVLADACSGKLTEDWREENGTEEWSNVSLVQLIPKGGIFDGPFGSNLKTSDYTSKGVRVVRLENIGHLAFISEKETFISKEKYESLKKHTVHEGDIIFSSFISESIRVCMLPKLSTAAIAKADCFCIRPFANRVLRDYLLLQLACSHTYNQLVEQIHGATRPRINTTQLKALKVRVCAIDEQREIVSRVNRLFAIADSAEEHHAKAKARVEQISQSVLSMAFRGELLQS